MRVEAGLLRTIIQSGGHDTTTENDRKSVSQPTLLEALFSQQGINSVTKWFQTHATVVSNPTAGPASLRGAGVRALLESDFLPLMRRLTDLPEHELFELFDLLDKECRGAIGRKEFILLLAILASRNSNERLQVLYMHGRDMYDLLAGSRRGWQAIRIWGLLFEIKDSVLWESRVNLEVPLGPTLTFQDFQLLFFAAIRADTSSQEVSTNGGKKKAKRKDKDASNMCAVQ
mmetsp:Transcript_17204/g.37412  ORF Transcript_17204/g.37412 Transcript_17204/m.37412 type:complete len:230 (-) Transcript_17204:198-887(-)|eukprot:CAMPEP_0118951198 /NCGR_PEP_ID=MMETSP1169-20130426/52705_1 /TAXON_ID=36882 /ORGANISM="Pyramimonas obovata, Strain CCMP722" /LENGTH=229 /DNA_ID=CAMNT_0006898209 /DNA_START=157 /DNA_END=846 /DNA_ORIENTATION=-